MFLPRDVPLVGKSVRNGSGTKLGAVERVVTGLDGGVASIFVREDSGKLWRIEAYHVRAVESELVQLKGPREGFHIAPLGGSVADPVNGEVAGNFQWGQIESAIAESTNAAPLKAHEGTIINR